MPSLFFEFPCKPGKDEGDGKIVAWSDTEPVVAVGTDAQRVIFFEDEGEQTTEHTIVRDADPTCIAWQPNSKIVAVGWADGVVSLWHTRVRILQPDDNVHKTPLCFCRWSEDGTRLITGDRGGIVGVWQTDVRGRLMPVCHYRKSGAITQCVFAAFNHPADAAKDGAGKGKGSSSFTRTSFFFAGALGVVSYADDMGHCMNVQSLRSPVLAMLYFDADTGLAGDRVVIITESLLLTQLEISAKGKVSPVMKVKLSAGAGVGPDVFRGIWVGPGLLLTSSGESMLRFWDLRNDNNFTISIADFECDPPVGRRDQVTCVAYNKHATLLAVGTKAGMVLMWRFRGKQPTDEEVRLGAVISAKARNWEPCFNRNMGVGIHSLEWAKHGVNILGVTTVEGRIFMLSETVLQNRLNSQLAALQQSPDELIVELKNGRSLPVKCGVNIRGLEMCENLLVVWDGKAIEVYELDEGDGRDPRVELRSTFESKATTVGIAGKSLYCAVGSEIQVCNFQGIKKDTLSFTDTEGEPAFININAAYMAVVTKRGTIKIYNISRRVAKQIGSAVRFLDAPGGPGSGEVRSIRVNAEGTRVSILMNSASAGYHTTPDTRLHVFNTELGAVGSYDFGPERYPVSHIWDPVEPRLVAIEAVAVNQQALAEEEEDQDDVASGEKRPSDNGERCLVTTIFATNDHGVLAQDSFPLNRGRMSLLGICVPRLFFLLTKPPKKSGADDGDDGGDGGGRRRKPKRRLKSRLMRDFVGLDKVTDKTRDALLDFSFNLTVGNMDAAYRAVKQIQSAAVWENMAHMCVKTKRLDVAEVCLGNMGHARGAAAVRESKREPETNAAIAMVAVQLGLLDDAEQLYIECKRFDLLNDLYRSSGQWKKAINVAQRRDRIHLKTTHYRYAQHLESLGDTGSAIKHYELADAHRYEVPRMLFDGEHMGKLEQYINSKHEPKLLKWWAQYCESSGDYDNAMRYYKKADDFLSQVRLCCFNRDFDEAADIVADAGDMSRAAAYHLARQHEAHGNVKQALQFFSAAGRFNHGVRLAKENGMDEELLGLAQSSPPAIMKDAAKHFEKKKKFAEAVELYNKSGNMAYAIELCFTAQLFAQLAAIAEGLESDADPALLERCAKFFIENEQYDKAASLCITAKKYDKALELCMNHKVTITDKMAERMTLPKKKSSEEGAADWNENRNKLLMAVARCCKKQGDFHLATKKYTQAGKKMKAMKCLLKSNDVEKIIFFAGVSRQREIYILAANYLQNLDFHADAKVKKAIIQFYTKARAFEQLSAFYNAVAQMEIDEYRDYDKALGALKDAVKYLQKVRKPGAETQEKLATLQQRCFLIERFVQARTLQGSDPEEMVKICGQLLEQPSVEVALRVGDVFALLVEYNYKSGKMDSAMKVIEKMQKRNIQISSFLDHRMLVEIHEANGLKYAPDGDDDDDDDEIDDDIDDEIDDDMEEDIPEDDSSPRGKSFESKSAPPPDRFAGK